MKYENILKSIGNTPHVRINHLFGKDYQLILVMPESMSIERRKLMSAYGAMFELTPRELGMKGAIEKATEIVSKNSKAWMPQQFDNPSNIEVHMKHTAQEII